MNKAKGELADAVLCAASDFVYVMMEFFNTHHREVKGYAVSVVSYAIEYYICKLFVDVGGNADQLHKQLMESLPQIHKEVKKMLEDMEKGKQSNMN